MGVQTSLTNQGSQPQSGCKIQMHSTLYKIETLVTNTVVMHSECTTIKLFVGSLFDIWPIGWHMLRRDVQEFE